MSDEFKEKCLEYFGTSDFYDILNVSHDASEKEIKKAYHKLSLLVHPDRVEENKKLIATEKFKVLGKVHSILQDKEKRKVYDDCGEFDEESEAPFNWMEYWQAMFKPITKADYEKYKEEYFGSEAEIRDIKSAYVGGKGNMDYMLEMVPFSSPESEPRILEVVRKLIDAKEVEEYDGFFNEPKKKKEKRLKKWAEEKEECERMETDDDELVKQIQEASQRRRQAFAEMLEDIEKKHSKTSKRKSLENGEGTAKRRKGAKGKKGADDSAPKRTTRSSTKK